MSAFEAYEYLQALTPVYYSVPSKEADRSAVGHSRQKTQGSYGKDRLSHFFANVAEVPEAAMSPTFGVDLLFWPY